MSCLLWAELLAQIRVVFVVMNQVHIGDLLVFVLRAGEDGRCGGGGGGSHV
jgi:hypothetical protein